MSDDRDYYRRQDQLRDERLREYRRQDEQRDDLRREQWLEDERRADWEREDREYDARQRDENHRRSIEEMRRGNTAWALNYMVGPDAAINYLNTMSRASHDDTDDTSGVEERDSPATEPSWPLHTFVTTTDELLANVATTPFGVTLRAARIDADGDGVVEAVRATFPGMEALWKAAGLTEPDDDSGRFWVKSELLVSIGRVAAVLRRGADLAAALEQLGSGH
jgi:hypothetical protein